MAGYNPAIGRKCSVFDGAADLTTGTPEFTDSVLIDWSCVDVLNKHHVFDDVGTHVFVDQLNELLLGVNEFVT